MSSLSDFLGEIGRHQLLTPEKELTMGRKVQEMVVLINRCQTAGGKGSACEYSKYLVFLWNILSNFETLFSKFWFSSLVIFTYMVRKFLISRCIIKK